MEEPTEMREFTLNKTHNNQEKDKIRNEKIKNQEDSQSSDERDPNPNDNTDNENNIVIIQSSNESPKKRNTIKDFKISFILGKGSYAKVVLATNIYTNKQYALKIIDKLFLAKEKKEHEVHIEKYMLSILNHPLIIKLFSTFQDMKKLYFILQYCPNRDFSDFIRSKGKLTKELTKFYAAEIVTALEYMNKKGIYHRDLKPENILLDEKMHIKIIDFSTAVVEGMRFDKKTMKFIKVEEYKEKNKVLQKGINNNQDSQSDDSEKEDEALDITQEFVGTPEYVSPEVLLRNFDQIFRAVDLWALGCIIYRCLHGHTPFRDKTNNLIFEKILNISYKLDEGLDENSKDIIKRLLVREPVKRLGAGKNNSGNDLDSLKAHPFFEGIDWDTLTNSDPPIEISDMSLNTNGFKLYEDQHSLSPIKRTSRVEKKINSFTEIPPFVINLNTVSKDAENKEIKEDEKEELIFESIVQKKSPWFHYNTRILRLYLKGKLEYLEPKSLKTKGTINLNNECEAVFVDDFRFDLITKSRRYIFKVKSNNKNTNKISKTWVEKINSIIENLKV